LYRKILDPKGELLPPIQYVLTNNETIVARHLFEEGKASGIAPDPGVIARRAGVSHREALDAYDLLDEFRFLEHVQKKSPSHYRLTPEAKKLHRADFVFTQFTRASRATFNVASPEAGIRLAETTFAAEASDLQTICAHCSERIDLRFDHGTLIATDPKEPWVLIRERTGANLCFSSVDHWQQYATEQKLPVGAQAVSIREYLTMTEQKRRHGDTGTR
jgi:hypothetical protein